MSYQTDQEAFWAGEFGSAYIGRNQGDALLAANIAFFARALRAAGPVGSCLEVGANIGMNLRALKLLHPQQRQGAVEINAEAARQLRAALPEAQVHEASILEAAPPGTWDLVLIKGVLIHINPDFLPQVYDRLVAASNRYVMVAEYYNPTPVALPYRGHEQRLFKRDFAGELMDRHPAMQLVDYGFAYRRDPVYPQDDITWFLLEKRG
jgi:pseudaminic acid biosynthesis-associated methylase